MALDGSLRRRVGAAAEVALDAPAQTGGGWGAAPAGSAGSPAAGGAADPGQVAAEEEALALQARCWAEGDQAPLQQAEEVLAWMARRYAPAVLACSFGAEDCLLVEMISRVAPSIGVFYLDTELLFAETYATRDRLIERYGIRPIQVLPVRTVEQQASDFGPALWSRDPDACCRMRKVEPLARVLADHRAWVTGIRRQQSPARAGAPLVEWDRRFGLAKGNPLAAWTEREVWAYIADHDVPYNPLHDRGYPSIGCWPCTRAVQPGEDPRAGRWSGFAKTECGLHG